METIKQQVPPHFYLEADGSITELTPDERQLLFFYRCLPADLKPEFDKVFQDDGRPLADRLAAFQRILEPRRDELHAAGYRDVTASP